MNIAATTDRLPTEILPADRLLTAAEFQKLADVPPEVEWFANISNRHTRRAYENAVKDFMRFAGILRPEEFRAVTRAHLIAWRDELRPARARRRDDPAPAGLAGLAVRISLREERRHPQPGQRRRTAEVRKRRRQDAGDRRPPGARPARSTRGGKRQ